MTSNEADLALVRRVQHGDSNAYNLLVLKYQHKVANLVSRYVNNASDVPDVTQEAFIKAYRGLKNFRGDSAFYTWLYRISVNAAKNHLVSTGRRNVERSMDADETGTLMAAADKLHDHASPEREARTDELRNTIRQAIEDLPIDLRTAIALREFDGLSYDEIAEAMDCPIGTVRSRIFRAREAIEAKFRPLMDGEQTGLKA